MYLRLAALSLAAAIPLLLTAGEAPETAVAPPAPAQRDFAPWVGPPAEILAADPRDPGLALATAAAAADRAEAGRRARGLAADIGAVAMPAGD